MPRVIHFEIPADDPERAVKFYQEVFGWEIEKWEGPFDYWLITTGDESEAGINGAIMTKMMGDQMRNTIAVESFDDFATKILKSGGKSVIPKMTIPGIGIMGSFEDTEGNAFLIMEPHMD
ncbi:VOC family protein [Methanobacterium alcaliphilum]|uniref:VOC family protein n=1 Tax=Methanobacterium alcaliphilum TaxID=392018 RepID=UPI00200A2C7E|nr:VOC family protein [Methanobacterium alcaliphilum]MCK9151029.1 VOC family protein [Methanobacterium alcaliphilum]